MKKIFFTLVFLFCAVFSMQAAYFKDVPRVLVQPNGDTVHCFITGDEYYNYIHDENGFTIIQNVHTGYFVYADKINGQLVPTSYIAGKTNPAVTGLLPHLNISADEWLAKRKTWEQSIPQYHSISQKRDYVRNQGNFNNLVLCIRFADDTTEIATPYSTMDAMFNDSTANAISMFTYFKSASYNKLFIHTHFYPVPVNNQVVSYQDIYPRNYYLPYSATNPAGYTSDERTDREFELLQRAVLFAADSIPDNLDLDMDEDGRVDNIAFVVKGNVSDWNTLLWPHRWSLYSRNVYIHGKRVWDFNFLLETAGEHYFGVSTLCHEMFHTFGAPDLYHYDQGNLSPVGIWDLMESNTTPPQHSGAYMKQKYGNWIEYIPVIPGPGTYTLKPISSETTEDLAYIIPSSDPSQFYVLEYRNKATAFESGLPGSGMLIYRIDQRFNGNAAYNGVNTFDEIYLFRPNGTTTANGTVNNAYFSANVNRTSFSTNTNPYPFLTDGTMDILSISDISEAGDSITFTYNVEGEVFNVSQNSMYILGKEGNSDYFSVAANVPWIAHTNSNRISISHTSGQSTQKIDVTVLQDLNFTYEVMDTIIVSSPGYYDQYIFVTLAPYGLIVSADSISFSRVGGEKSFEVYGENMWRINGRSEWLHLNLSQGIRNRTVKITTDPFNVDTTDGNTVRSCTLTIVMGDIEKRVLIKQTSSMVSVQELEEQQFCLYPNPVKEEAIFQTTHPDIIIEQISICSFTGQMIWSVKPMTNRYSWKMKDWSVGCYFIIAKLSNGQIIKKQVIKS